MAIEHVFVLMLENRSFDHLFGFSAICGTDAVTGAATSIEAPDSKVNINEDDDGKPFPVSQGADFSLKGVDVDPGHEFGDVAIQLTGPNLGFVRSYGAQPDVREAGRVMECFGPADLPVLNQLAAEFVICDHWFSSLPGPTWPNRFFMMAATSGGLTKSPSTGDIIKATALEGYSFEGGNIFDALDKKGIPWCIVEGDKFPISFALKGMDANARKGRFVDIGDFAAKIGSSAFTEKFIFIEPQYGAHKLDITGPGDFSGGNSMHPLDDVRMGEQLVRQVYETIRSVPAVWGSSVLLITFDEHGGFYDHVETVDVTAPGDDERNAAPGQQPFDFARSGVRVPAIIVSPLIPKNRIDHTGYDHTSALATIGKLFSFGPLTRRDGAAKDFSQLFTLGEPRADTPVTLVSGAAGTALAPEAEDSPGSLRADLVQLEGPGAGGAAAGGVAASGVAASGAAAGGAEAGVTGPQAGFAYVGLMRALSQAGSDEEKEAWKQEFRDIRTRRDAARLMTRAKLKIHFGQYVPRVQAG
jgi:phospholipase C